MKFKFPGINYNHIYTPWSSQARLHRANRSQGTTTPMGAAAPLANAPRPLQPPQGKTRRWLGLLYSTTKLPSAGTTTATHANTAARYTAPAENGAPSTSATSPISTTVQATSAGPIAHANVIVRREMDSSSEAPGRSETGRDQHQANEPSLHPNPLPIPSSPVANRPSSPVGNTSSNQNVEGSRAETENSVDNSMALRSRRNSGGSMHATQAEVQPLRIPITDLVRLCRQVTEERPREIIRVDEQRTQVPSRLPPDTRPPAIGSIQSSAVAGSSAKAADAVGIASFVSPGDGANERFASVVVQMETNGGKGLGVAFPPGSESVFSLGSDAIDRGLHPGMSVFVEVDRADKPYVRIPAAYPANISGLEHVAPLLPSLRAQRAVRTWKQSSTSSQMHPASQAEALPAKAATSGQPLWTPQSFRDESAKHDWCTDLNDAQSAALVEFMNRAHVASLDDVGSALPTALFGSHRLAFEATCAVYASGVGDITECDDEGNNCLHTMVRVHDPVAVQSAWADLEARQGVPPLEAHERFAEAIRLGADPFAKNNAGESAFDLALEQGCLEDLLRGMSEALPPQEVGRALAWKSSKRRNILSVMAGVNGEGLAEVRKLVARKVCKDFPPKLAFEIAPNQQAAWEVLQQKVDADWAHQLDTRQVAAVARFMKEAHLESASASEVADDLPRALATGFRPAFEAARAVYASGVCDVNDRNEDGHSCLHDLSLEQKAAASSWG
jgi:hypothetical protein